MAIQKESSEVQVNIFLMADAIGCALPNQDTPQGLLASVKNNR